MLQKILNENWSAYDNRKIRDKRDSSKFSCEEKWEVDYLVEYIRKHVSYKTEEEIRGAISSCCKTLKAPHPRAEFIECVLHKLK